MEKFGDAQASRVIQALETRATRKLRDGAQIATTWGTVAEISADQKTAGAYLYGENTSEYVSGGFRVPEATYLTVGDVVKVAMNYATGERWIDEVHYPATAYKKVAVSLSDSSIRLGGGAAAPDHRIWRSSTGLMVDTDGVATTAGFSVEAVSGQASVHNMRVAGDSFNRTSLRGDGSIIGIMFGPGNAAQDVNLYRRIAGTLSTDDAFEVLGTAAGTAPNAGSEHTYQYIDIRSATYALGRISVVQPTGRYADSADMVFFTGHGGPLTERFRIIGDTATVSVTGTLNISQMSYATKGFRTMTKAGVPSDSDFTGLSYGDGLLVVDTTNNRLYVRTGGGLWKYATLT